MNLIFIIIAVIIYFAIGGFLQGLLSSYANDDVAILWLWPIVVPYILALTAGEKLAKLRFKRRYSK